MVLQRAYETLVDDKKEVANIPASNFFFIDGNVYITPQAK
ncbi:MAG: hypothetical protein PWP69_1695 [Enterococcus sp.]|nr:hypothetical protein [Enterococcus sp.]